MMKILMVATLILSIQSFETEKFDTGLTVGNDLSMVPSIEIEEGKVIVQSSITIEPRELNKFLVQNEIYVTHLVKRNHSLRASSVDFSWSTSTSYRRGHGCDSSASTVVKPSQRDEKEKRIPVRTVDKSASTVQVV